MTRFCASSKTASSAPPSCSMSRPSVCRHSSSRPSCATCACRSSLSTRHTASPSGATTSAPAILRLPPSATCCPAYQSLPLQPPPPPRWSTTSARSSPLSPQPSAVSLQPPAISHQPSALSHLPPAISSPSSACRSSARTWHTLSATRPTSTTSSSTSWNSSRAQPLSMSAAGGMPARLPNTSARQGSAPRSTMPDSTMLTRTTASATGSTTGCASW